MGADTTEPLFPPQPALLRCLSFRAGASFNQQLAAKWDVAASSVCVLSTRLTQILPPLIITSDFQLRSSLGSGADLPDDPE